MSDPQWLVNAEKYLDFHEIGNNRGLGHFIELAGVGEQGDPWCAIFVNACLKEAGVRGSGSARARSFEHDPDFIRLREPVRGCIVTRWRGSPDGGLGHVYFFLEKDEDGYRAIAGNEDDAVREYTESPSKVTGFWWPKAVALTGKDQEPTAAFFARGKVSSFGGPNDRGGQPDEGLALFSSERQMEEAGLADYLLPDNGWGLFRRLNPDKLYCAARWDYSDTPAKLLREATAVVTNATTGDACEVRPVDWGPNIRTGRAVDISPGAMRKIHAQTDDVVILTIRSVQGSPEPDHAPQPAPGTIPVPEQRQLPPPQVVLTPEEWKNIEAALANAAKIGAQTARASAPWVLPLLLRVVRVVFPQAAPFLAVAQIILTQFNVMGGPALLSDRPSVTGTVMAGSLLATFWSGLWSRLAPKPQEN